tara:strand:+ start:2416 stop:2793 length:378 start_codon:yes stop_codon:yes gene_type:complete
MNNNVVLNAKAQDIDEITRVLLILKDKEVNGELRVPSLGKVIQFAKAIPTYALGGHDAQMAHDAFAVLMYWAYLCEVKAKTPCFIPEILSIWNKDIYQSAREALTAMCKKNVGEDPDNEINAEYN